MYSIWILIVLIVLVISCELSTAVRLLGISTGKKVLGYFRGGARGRSNNRAITTKSKRSKRIEEDEYDDDGDDDEYLDDDEYEDDRYSRGRSRHAKKRSHPKEKQTGYSLIPWGSGSKNRDSRRSQKGSGGFSIREKIEQIAKSGQSAYKDIYRRAKVFKSSAFEGILLKATWPTETPVPQEMLTDLIKYSIPAFKYTRSESEEDPYYMTLHKLWTKMTERDWRTVVKSLYILHCISRDSSEESCRHFATAIKSLSKARNPKKPDQKYYDLRVISEVDVNSQSYQPFIKAYAGYIIQRTKFFSGKFEEFGVYLSASTSSPPTTSSPTSASSAKTRNKGSSVVNTILSSDSIVATISSEALLHDTAAFQKFITLVKRVEQLIKQGLLARVTKKQINVVTGQIMKTMTQDIKDLWCLYDRLVSSYLVSSANKLDISTINTETAKQLKEVLTFYQDHLEKVESYLSDHQKLFKSLKVKLPSTQDRQVQLDVMRDRIDELVKLSGGAIVEEDDDVDDDDESSDYDEDEDEEEVDDEDEEGNEGEEDDLDSDEDELSESVDSESDGDSNDVGLNEEDNGADDSLDDEEEEEEQDEDVESEDELGEDDDEEDQSLDTFDSGFGADEKSTTAASQDHFNDDEEGSVEDDEEEGEEEDDFDESLENDDYEEDDEESDDADSDEEEDD